MWRFVMPPFLQFVIRRFLVIPLYWWVFAPATLAIMLFGIAWNLLGGGLVDLFDPRSYA